jgi:hypothetical protein
VAELLSLGHITRMTLTLLLLSLFALLVGFLMWRRVPRRQLFQILHVSAWIYAISFFIGLQIADRAAPRLTEGFLPYLLPVLPIGLFVAWAMHRQKSVQR